MKQGEYILTPEEAIVEIQKDNRVTIVFEEGFPPNSDTEDVFRGLFSDEGFENSEDCLFALDGGEFEHTMFRFNGEHEANQVNRLVKEGHWTMIYLDEREHPTVSNSAVVILNKNRLSTEDKEE